MSDLAEHARVHIFLADYAAADAGNKINAIGLGFKLAGLQNTGLSAPFTVAVLVDIHPDHFDHQAAFELGLYSDDGELVSTPGPTGTPQAIRFAQNLQIERPRLMTPAGQLPSGHVWARCQVVANFGTGLPLPLGHGYEWRVSLDSYHDDNWSAIFAIPGPPPPVVMG